VLNVGAKDESRGPLLFMESSMKLALQKIEDGKPCPSSLRLAALAKRSEEHEDVEPHHSYIIKDGMDLSDVLISRLASVIRAAGKNAMVVLSSSWRKPSHRRRRELLEGCLAKHLPDRSGFTFDAITDLREEKKPEDRLKTIGDFLQRNCNKKGTSYRALVLEDFFIHSIGGWSCQGISMNSLRDVERYLVRRTSGLAKVKFLHTYEEWLTDSGMLMQVGSGLTKRHFEEAMAFVKGASNGCETSLPGSIAMQPFRAAATLLTAPGFSFRAAACFGFGKHAKTAGDANEVFDCNEQVF